jgi:AcrR family transcriptional regulator
MPRQSTATRTKILEAARMLLSMHGFENTTIDDMLTAAGVTKGAFYHYFKSKDALGQAVVEQALADYQAMAESLPSASPRETLGAVVKRIGELNASGEWLNCRLMLRLLSEAHDDSPLIEAALAAFWQWYRGFYYDLLVKCRQAGQIGTTLDEQSQLHLLLSMLAGTCMINQIDQAAPPLADFSERILKSL